MGYNYCPLSEVIRAAQSKGVRLLKSDLVNNEAESINQCVVMFRGVTAQLVNAIYDSGVSGPTIEEMLKLLRGGDLLNGGRDEMRHSDIHASDATKCFCAHSDSEISLENVYWFRAGG